MRSSTSAARPIATGVMSPARPQRSRDSDKFQAAVPVSFPFTSTPCAVYRTSMPSTA